MPASPRTVSCCMLAGDDPARVRAILALVRPHVDEIVLAADDRRADAILSACADLVDRPLRFEYALTSARYVGWIQSECSGDWILRLDDDEVPGAELLAALPAIAAERRPTHATLPYRHVVAPGDRYLVSHPWHPDHHVRLVQNVPGVWSFDGTMHTEAEVLGERRRLPFCVYHVNYAIRPLAERRAKAAWQEAQEPGRITEAYEVNALYLPEAWTGVETAPVPEADRPLVAALLDPEPVPAQREVPPAAPLTTAAEANRHNCVRTVGPGAYAARVTLTDRRRRLAAGTIAHLEVLTANLGDEPWPPAHEPEPPIRLASRWLEAQTGKQLTDGLRTPFEERVLPGEETRTMLAVQVPDTPGDYLLEIDVVHELVRWFGGGERILVAVEHLDAPPPGASAVAGPPLARPNLLLGDR